MFVVSDSARMALPSFRCMPLHILVGAVLVLRVYFTFSSHFKPPFVKMRQFDGVSKNKKKEEPTE